MSYFDSKKSKNLSDKKNTKYSLYGGNFEFQKQAINETKCHILIQKNQKIYQTKKTQNTHCTGETMNSKNRL